MRTKGLVSDVTFGVGLAALGASVLVILLRPSEKAAAPGAAARLVLTPTPGGALAGLGGRF